MVAQSSESAYILTLNTKPEEGGLVLTLHDGEVFIEEFVGQDYLAVLYQTEILDLTDDQSTMEQAR